MHSSSRVVLTLCLTALVGCAASDNGNGIYGTLDGSARTDVRPGDVRPGDGAAGDHTTPSDGPLSGDSGGGGSDGGLKDVGTAPGDGSTGDDATSPGDGGAVGDGGTGCVAREVCNDGLDNNCNGRVDEDCPCIPGMTSRCYDGPPGRAGVGVCNYGMTTCEGTGEFGSWSACRGSGQPQPVICGMGMDYRCTGNVDEGCACPAGMTRECYGGPMSTAGVGLCRGGMQTCVVTDGMAAWGECIGQVIPAPDMCDGMDRDCDGNPATGCSCTRGTNRACYGGPMGTAGVGTCRAGRQSCVATADGSTTEWGRCEGEVLPSMNMCDGIDHACTGRPDEGCECTAGMTRACYTGAAATRRVGICRDGTQTCTVSGSGSMWATACPGEVRPNAMELCGNSLDDNCNGMVDEGCGGMLMCPADTTVPAGTPVSLPLVGTGLRTIAWTIVSAPTGGAGTVVWAPNPPTAMTESFTPYIVGTYTLRVTAVDASGRTVTCMFNVTALPHGLRVQLTWNGTGDVDLHLHNATSSAWFNADDCYYGNLRPFGAVLDFDNTSTTGPENIRVDTPTIGSAYTVAVHNYARASGRVATVQIFCGSTTSTTPTGTYNSRAFTLSGSGNCANNDFWRVARVVFTSATTCTITPINSYTTGSAACTGF